MCVRAGRYWRLTPLIVNLHLGSYGLTLQVVVTLSENPDGIPLRAVRLPLPPASSSSPHQVCRSLMEPKRLASSSYQAFRSNVSHVAFVTASPETIDGMLESLGNLLNLLDTSAAENMGLKVRAWSHSHRRARRGMGV